MNNTELFSSKSEDYSKFRPSYPDVAVDWLFEKCGDVQTLDIGAGTGIFTKVLLRKFSKVSAVEPNDDMRAQFRKFLPEIVCFSGTGEATGCPDASVDLITVAQAFHWLDAERFKAEAMRILRPGGKIAIVWNTSCENDFTRERNSVCQKYCPGFRSGHAGKHTAAEGDAFLRNCYFKSVEVVAFDNPFKMDRCTFEGNIRSRSYALTPEHPDCDRFMAEQRAVFDRHAAGGFVIEPQETQIYFGNF